MRNLLRLAALILTASLALLESSCGCGGGGSGGGGGGSLFSPFNRTRGFDERVFSVALANDGSGDVFAAGFFTTYGNTPSKGVARIHRDGSIDTTFAVGSKLNGVAFVVAPATDGSGDVYVGGSFATYDGNSSGGIVRLNRDGSYDAGFSVGAGFNDSVYAIVPAVDGSGDVFVGGNSTSLNGNPTNGVVRMNSNGTLDSGWTVVTSGFIFVRTIAPAVDGSGDVYVGGGFTAYGASTLDNIVRLNSDGSPDPGFAVANGGLNATVWSIVAATDGSGDVYVGGDFSANVLATSWYRLLRMKADGSVDTSFPVGAGFFSVVRTIAFATDGSGDLLVGGDLLSYQASPVPGLLRLNPNATVDPGLAVGTGFKFIGSVYALAVEPGGAIYAGGDFVVYQTIGANRLLRIAADGSPDLTFSVGSGCNDWVNAVAAVNDASGDIYVGGQFDVYNGASSRGMVRVRADGSVNPLLSVGAGFNGAVEVIEPTRDGSGDVYVTGSFTGYNMGFQGNLLRLHSNGTLDPGFTTTGASSNIHALSAARDGSGDLYIGGAFASYNGSTVDSVARVNANGSLDTGFVTGSGFSGGAGYGVRAIATAVDGSGDVYYGGDFTVYNGTGSVRIIRLQSSGAINGSFAVGTGFDNIVRSILPLGDGSGDLLVAGDFTLYQGAAAPHLIRLSATGAPVPSFAVGTGFNAAVNSLAAATDGSGDVFAGGLFDSYKAVTSRRIARIRPDGSLAPIFALGTGFDFQVLSVIPGPLGSVYAGGQFRHYKTTVVDRITRISVFGDLD